VTVTVVQRRYQLNPISFTMRSGERMLWPQVLNVATLDNSSMRFGGSVGTLRVAAAKDLSRGNGCCFTPLAIRPA